MLSEIAPLLSISARTIGEQLLQVWPSAAVASPPQYSRRLACALSQFVRNRTAHWAPLLQDTAGGTHPPSLADSCAAKARAKAECIAELPEVAKRLLSVFLAAADGALAEHRYGDLKLCRFVAASRARVGVCVCTCARVLACVRRFSILREHLRERMEAWAEAQIGAFEQMARGFIDHFFDCITLGTPEALSCARVRVSA